MSNKKKNATITTSKSSAARNTVMQEKVQSLDLKYLGLLAHIFHHY